MSGYACPNCATVAEVATEAEGLEHTCEQCGTKICVEICSGEAITTNPEGETPLFDREKCIHCGACIWNCSQDNIRLEAGAGGLHSAEN